MIVEEVLNNSVRFHELFNEAVDYYYNADCSQKDIPKEYALSVWAEMCEHSFSVLLTDKDTESKLFCVYKASQYTPHIVGEGLTVVAMFSTTYNTKLYRRLRKFLVARAKEFGCTWLHVSHKVRTGVYEDTYKRI